MEKKRSIYQKLRKDFVDNFLAQTRESRWTAHSMKVAKMMTSPFSKDVTYNPDKKTGRIEVVEVKCRYLGEDPHYTGRFVPGAVVDRKFCVHGRFDTRRLLVIGRYFTINGGYLNAYIRFCGLKGKMAGRIFSYPNGNYHCYAEYDGLIAAAIAGGKGEVIKNDKPQT